MAAAGPGTADLAVITCSINPPVMRVNHGRRLRSPAISRGSGTQPDIEFRKLRGVIAVSLRKMFEKWL
jgi:hypothetical protein